MDLPRLARYEALMTGTNFLNDNRYDGLYIDSYGSISLSNVTATGMKAAWMDNSQHGKNANVALGDGSVQAFGISKLREGFKNSGDSNNRLLFP